MGGEVAIEQKRINPVNTSVQAILKTKNTSLSLGYLLPNDCMQYTKYKTVTNDYI